MSKETYRVLVESLMENDEVTQSRKSGFGSGLRVNGKVFAMLVKNKLCVKLPASMIDEIVAEGQGELYMSGGRPSKDWIVVDTVDEQRWLELAHSAIEFVSTKEA
ncbi:hypothetical protein [Herpetosiphon giganteus]|uniref:hypothetical protein n=1 Tax=Herpetosiphon giganteus TaxID=2029754 RepID=UPI00195DE307|nr:hypothetical protein [Herpetosiphon giganteus]MBM7845184.1 TfoX/Sxy family transcriptional regulator of competence genes [Herpetosiphon giganteus]